MADVRVVTTPRAGSPPPGGGGARGYFGGGHEDGAGASIPRPRSRLGMNRDDDGGGGGDDGDDSVANVAEEAAAADRDARRPPGRMLSFGADPHHGATIEVSAAGELVRGETPSWGYTPEPSTAGGSSRRSTATSPGASGGGGGAGTAPATGTTREAIPSIDARGRGTDGGSRLSAAADPADRAIARALGDTFHTAGGTPPRRGASPGVGGSNETQTQNVLLSSPPRARTRTSTGNGAGSVDTSVEYAYGRVLAPDDDLTSECEEVCLMLQHCVGLRDKYVFVSELERDPSLVRPDPSKPYGSHYPSTPRSMRALSGVSDPFAGGAEDGTSTDAAGGGGGGGGEEEKENDPSRGPRGSSVVTGVVDIVPDDDLPGASAHAFEMVAGVMHVYDVHGVDGGSGSSPTSTPGGGPKASEREGVLGTWEPGEGAATPTPPKAKGDAERHQSSRSSRSSRSPLLSLPGDARRTLAFAHPPSATEFFHDMHAVLRVHSYGPSKTFCHKRLLLTEQKFSLHVMLNADREFLAQKEAPHRDFYNVRKVDTHVHHSACMNQKHLLRFIKSKLKREPHEQVIYRDGKFLNLREVFESINLSSYDLNVDTLDMHADKNTFHRFDRFNLKYNPCGQSRLREVFIKQDNLIRGRFLAEVTKEVISDLEAAKYQMAEYRISVYGRRAAEWDTLASWVLNNRIFSNNVVWLIQLPRLYNIYRGQGTVQNFQQMLDNIFLDRSSRSPSTRARTRRCTTSCSSSSGSTWSTTSPSPSAGPRSTCARRRSGTSRTTRRFRTTRTTSTRTCTRSTDFANAEGIEHDLVPAARGRGWATSTTSPRRSLLTKNIAHGINLRKSPVLQYLYYLTQIGLNLSPLSNNSLFLDYHRNPFPIFFARGLKVALSTDDPLQIHMTKEPLVEEYSVAAQVWKMSAADLCEIARNSVLNSDFPHEDKRHWVSDTYWLSGAAGNDIKRTNVPSIRMQFRHDVLEAEKTLIEAGVRQATSKGRALQVS